MAELPPLQMSPLAQSAAVHHELYREWVAAGFSPEQAMQLLIETCRTAAALRRDTPPDL